MIIKEEINLYTVNEKWEVYVYERYLDEKSFMLHIQVMKHIDILVLAPHI